MTLTARAFPFLLVPGLVLAQAAGPYDIVLGGGRVMDPASGLEAVRYVGLRGDKIAAVSELPLEGKTFVDVGGLVVAPGFIDLHAHGQSNQANQYQARDGVTTALELEGGVAFVETWIRQRQNQALLNYGATVAHGAARALVMKELAAEVAARKAAVEKGIRVGVSGDAVLLKARYKELTHPEEFTQLAAELEKGLREGALGIGMPHQYYPGATRTEIFRVFQMAARWKVPIFTHVRSMGIDAMQEVLANAAATGASLHIVHVNSSSRAALPEVLEMIGSARSRGLDVTTEAYPYTAGSTSIQSAIFDEGWQQRLGGSYSDLQWQDTGERLTQETFEKYRKTGGVLIIHMMKPEWIDLAMSTPFVMIASDGMPYAPGAHPRGAETFSRVLGRYVRERKALTLMEALRRMTLMPAGRLEPIAPQMKNKGRLQAGADADITVFDPEAVIDTATFETGLRFSKGIQHVLVNGVFVVRNGDSVPGVLPGRAVMGRYGQAQ